MTFFRHRWIVLSAAAGVLAAGSIAQAQNTAGQPPLAESEAKEHPLDPFLKTAGESREAIAEAKDYTALFRKMEVVRGKAYTHTMMMKLRHEPFSVYLYFPEAHKGRQVLYVAGENNGKLLARSPGIGGLGVTLKLDPTGKTAMAEGRFPITNIGMLNLVDAVIEQWKAEKKMGKIKTEFYPNAKLQRPGTNLKPMECKVLQTSHPTVREGVEYAMTRLYIEKKTNLPVRVEQYGFPRSPNQKPPLLAEYTYWNVRTDVGLKNLDFNPKNPRYKF